MRLEQHDIVTLDEAESVDSLTKKLGDLLVNQKLRLTSAESCPGGKLASALCAAEDTPSFYGVGYVTFTDEAKAKILRVQRHSLAEHTAVSEAVVTEMAQGAKDQAEVTAAMAVRKAAKMARRRAQFGLPGILTIQLLQADNISTEIVRKYWKNAYASPSLNCFFC
ncbi:competence damage-inducible protein A [Salmonella enterica subsp. enterica serovar Typhi]|nr:competence damage-inducible protein A [Salmonella enterica subsp. enterica serovar Typhi]